MTTSWVLSLLAVMSLVVVSLASPAFASGAPAAPNDLSSSVEAGSPQLSWSQTAGAVGYNVYRDGQYLTTVTSPPFVDRSATASHSYYVTAFDTSRSLFSGRSNEVHAAAASASTSSTSSSGVSTQTLDTPHIASGWSTFNYITFEIAAVSGAAGYNVYRDGEYLETIYSTFFEDNPGRAVAEYSVAAFNEGATVFSPRSESLEMITYSQYRAYPGSPPETPANFAASFNGEWVELSWDGPDEESVSFTVYRDSELIATTDRLSVVDADPRSRHTYLIYANRQGWSSSVARLTWVEGDVVSLSARSGFGSAFVVEPGVVTTSEISVHTESGSLGPGTLIQSADFNGYSYENTESDNGRFSSTVETFSDGTTRQLTVQDGVVTDHFERDANGNYNEGSIVDREVVSSPEPERETSNDGGGSDPDFGGNDSGSDPSNNSSNNNTSHGGDTDNDSNNSGGTNNGGNQGGHNVENPGVCCSGFDSF